jgi:hypothetical protein
VHPQKIATVSPLLSHSILNSWAMTMSSIAYGIEEP